MNYNGSGPTGSAPRALRPIQVPGYGGAIPVSDGNTVSLIGFKFTPTPDGGFDVTRFSKGELPTVTGIDLTSILRQCQVLAPLAGGGKGAAPPATNTRGAGNDAAVLQNSANPLAPPPVRDNGLDPRCYNASPFNNRGAYGVPNAVPPRVLVSGATGGMVPPAECQIGAMPPGYGVPARPNYDAPWKSVAQNEIPLHPRGTEIPYDCRVPMACPDMPLFWRPPYEPEQVRGVPPFRRRSISPGPRRSISPVPRQGIAPARRRSISPNSRRSLSPPPLDSSAQAVSSCRSTMNRAPVYGTRSRHSRGGSGAPRPRRQSTSPVPNGSMARGPGRGAGSFGGRAGPPAVGTNRKEQHLARETLMDAHEVLTAVRNELETRDDIRSQMRPQDFKQFKAAVLQLETALDAEKKPGHRRTRSPVFNNYGAQPWNNDHFAPPPPR